jgi:hypothetical protein
MQVYSREVVRQRTLGRLVQIGSQNVRISSRLIFAYGTFGVRKSRNEYMK